MTEFKLEPIKQVIIHDLVHESLDNFLQQCATLGISCVRWVDGVMIYFSALISDVEAYKKIDRGYKILRKTDFCKISKIFRKSKMEWW